MTIRAVFASLVFACLVPAFALAKTHTHDGAKLTFDIPDSWKTEAEDDAIQTTSPDEEASIFFAIIPGDKLQEAVEGAEKQLSKLIQDQKEEGEPKEVEINGLKALALEGTGKIDGEAVEYGLMIVKTPSGKVLFVLGVAKVGGKHQKEIDGIFKSLKGI